MKTEDVHLVHRLWLNITREPGLEKLHHHDILTEALTRFARDYAGHDRDDILKELRKRPEPRLRLERWETTAAGSPRQTYCLQVCPSPMPKRMTRARPRPQWWDLKFLCSHYPLVPCPVHCRLL